MPINAIDMNIFSKLSSDMDNTDKYMLSKIVVACMRLHVLHVQPIFFYLKKIEDLDFF